MATAPENLKALIKEIAKKEGFDQYETVFNSLSSGGANFMGNLYSVDVKEAGRELNLFVKVSNTPEESRDRIRANEMYKREIFTYTTLANTFAELETKHAVPEEHRYKMSKFYGSDLTEFEEVVVLENLAKKGYGVYDRFKSVNWEFASAALGELAKFHALSYAMKRDYPEKFEVQIKSKKTLFGKEDMGDAAYVRYMEGLCEMAVAACDDKYVAAVTRFIEGLQQFNNTQNIPDEYSVLAHVDYRASNIMVKYEGGSIKSVIPIDFQTIFHGSPINDFLYFLFLGTDQQFRREHYEACIQHYYRSLGASLARLSLEIGEVYPKELFDRHLEEKLLFGLSMAIIALPLVLVDAEGAPGGEALFKSEMKGSALFNERFNGIVQDMLKWGALSL